jgi:hypothetical protein
MTSPVNVNVDLKGVNKLFDMLKSYFGVRIARRKAEAEASARVITAKADAEVKLLSARTDAEVRLISSQSTVDEKKVLVQGEHDLKQLEQKLSSEIDQPEGITDAEFEIVWEEPEALALAQEHRGPFQHVEEKRLNNIKQVTEEAMKALPEHTDVSDEPVDPDWFARFFDNVKDVSQENMQRLWGKLLAGEVAQSGRFSLRTLDVLRNLSSAEARLFERYCRFCTNDDMIIIPADEAFQNSVKINRNDTLRLGECGLLHDGEEINIGGIIGRPSAAAQYGNKVISVTRSHQRNKLLVTYVHQLTLAGKELAKLHSYDADEGYILAFREAAERHALVVEITNVTQDDAADAPDGENADVTAVSDADKPGKGDTAT